MTRPELKELLTPRLRLRAWRPSDLPDVLAMNSDPAVMRYVREIGSEAEETQRAHDLMAADRGGGLGIWAVEGREDAAFHGAGMLIPLPGYDDVEVGYRLPQASWGRGIATEIACRLRDYGFGELELTEIVAVTDPGNGASQRVLQKAGLSFRGLRTAYGVEGLHLFGLTREAWLRDQPGAPG